MREWQVVLEEFALNADPQTATLPRVRLPPAVKRQAIEYLLERDFLRIGGYRHHEEPEFLYEITPAGRFVWQAGWCRLRRKRPPGGWKDKKPATLTLAKELAALNPLTVWELAEKPWTWVKKLDYDRFTDPELAALGFRRVPPKVRRDR